MFFTYYQTLFTRCEAISSLFTLLHLEILWSIPTANERVEAKILLIIDFFTRDGSFSQTTSQWIIVHEICIFARIQLLFSTFTKLGLNIYFELLVPCLEVLCCDHFTIFFRWEAFIVSATVLVWKVFLLNMLNNYWSKVLLAALSRIWGTTNACRHCWTVCLYLMELQPSSDTSPLALYFLLVLWCWFRLFVSLVCLEHLWNRPFRPEKWPFWLLLNLRRLFTTILKIIDCQGAPEHIHLLWPHLVLLLRALCLLHCVLLR